MTRKQRLIPAGALMVFVALVLLLLTAVNSGAQAMATISSNVENPTVGDPIVLTVAVTHPEGHVVLFPELPPAWGDLIVRSQSAAETELFGDGTAVTRQQVDVRLFAPGAFTTPPLALTITDSAGNLSETFAEPIPLTIQSVLVEGDTELRDLKPQAELPLPALWPFILASLALVAAVAGGFWWWRRRRQKALVDNRLPHERALAALATIDAAHFVQDGRYQEQYAGVSDTLRRYFEAITEVPMSDKTTAEIRHKLASDHLARADAQRLLMLLEDSDMVKFAKVEPTRHEAERVTQVARQLVLDTRPVLEEADTDAGSPSQQGGRRAPKQTMEAAT